MTGNIPVMRSLSAGPDVTELAACVCRMIQNTKVPAAKICYRIRCCSARAATNLALLPSCSSLSITCLDNPIVMRKFLGMAHALGMVHAVEKLA